MYCSPRSTVKGTRDSCCTRDSVFKRIDERNMAVYPGVDKGEMMSALHIVDADGHIREDVSEIQEYLDPPFAGSKFFLPLLPGDGRFRGARIRTSPIPSRSSASSGSAWFYRAQRFAAGSKSENPVDNPKRLYGI
jgi:hypothetical protein